VGREAVARHGQRKGDFLAGKYLLEDCLGVGGMGEVYQATNVSLGRKVAIKVLSAECVHIEEDVLRFLREARAAAAVRHSNVVDVLDVARDDDGTPFIVQELLSGEDLEHYLHVRGGPLSFEEALEIMIPVADAVGAAHAHDVVHRDLKPANIFLSRERNTITPKVLDFGACLFPTIAERSAKEVRMLIGTPHYMAPEQIVSKADVDARSDVWALGVILYELLVGETPFEGDTADAVMQLVKTREVPPLRDQRRDAPVELEELIAQCTKRDRLLRFANAGALHGSMKAVRQILRGQPISSRIETATEIPKQHAPLPPLPDLEVSVKAAAPSAPALPEAERRRLLTLNNPGSLPPDSPDDFHLDIPLPTAMDSRIDPAPGSARRPVSVVPAEPARVASPFIGERGGTKEIEQDIPNPRDLNLAARPSSWPPPSMSSDSSMPPVLDPRAAKASTSVAPRDPNLAPPPVPRELRDDAPGSARNPAPSSQAGPRPPAVARPSAAALSGPVEWSLEMTVKFVAAVALPAVLGFIAILVIPAFGTPLGRALRGDSTLGSGLLAVTVLVCAAALCARTMMGEKRDRYSYVAAGGSVLFGIVMIIVTSSASEAAEAGIPGSMGGLSTLIAPVAPLALALGALARAREAWTNPYARGESRRAAAVASLMLFLTLALSPVGAVRTPAPAPHTPRGVLG
jgi:serine/threonine-protein kinase